MQKVNGGGLIPLGVSQSNILAGALQTSDPSTYLVAKTYWFGGVPPIRLCAALRATVAAHPLLGSVLVDSRNGGPAAGAIGAGGGYALAIGRTGDRTVLDLTTGTGDTTGDSDDRPGSLARCWTGGLTGRLLSRFTVSRDGHGVRVLFEAHHLVVDAGAVGVIESTLARYLRHPRHRWTGNPVQRYGRWCRCTGWSGRDAPRRLCVTEMRSGVNSLRWSPRPEEGRRRPV